MNNVNATINYYNHIQNPSFLSMSNYIEDSGFESGLFEQGLVYGNWTVEGQSIPASILLDYGHTGLYGLSFGEAGASSSYIFAEEYNGTLGSDVEKFYFFGYSGGASTEMKVQFNYTDSSISWFAYECGVAMSWIKIDVLAEENLHASKYIQSIKFVLYTTGYFRIDDVYFLVDDGGGQDSLGKYTTFWYREAKNPLYTVSSIDMGFNSTFGRLDNSSVYSRLYHKAYLRQSINYLDTDYIHYVSGFFYSNYGSEVGIRCIIGYTDGTISYKIENISADSTWEYVNFGKSFINTNKYINKVSFDVYSYISDAVYFDDVGLWASVELGYTRFGYTLSPYPISISYTSFHAYQQVQYIMSCYLYNASGGLSENGTYQFSDNMGFTTGDFENGIFSYVLTKRVSTQNFDEEITITIILTEEVINFQISATWQYVEAEDGVDVTSEVITNFMFLFIFIFVPSLFLAGITATVGIPIVGFISGLTMMTSIGKIVGIVPLWFLFVMVLVVALLILAMIKGRSIY